MSNPHFSAAVTFESVDSTRKWARYKVTDEVRGPLGWFRINVETGYIDEHDDQGDLALGAWFGEGTTTADFLDRFEVLNWLYEVFGTFLAEEEMPSYRYVST